MRRLIRRRGDAISRLLAACGAGYVGRGVLANALGTWKSNGAAILIDQAAETGISPLCRAAGIVDSGVDGKHSRDR
jgi:hypothetical protein